MNVRALLAEAIETGEVLSAIYHGGSQPGTKRRIHPHRVSDHLILAWCYNAGEWRNFRWEKLELVGENHPVADYVKLVPSDLGEVLWGPVEELKEIDWHVQSSEDAISVHRYRQNGKPRSHAVVQISKSGVHSKPWRVASLGLRRARCFSRLNHAARLFLHEARRLKPKAVGEPERFAHHRDALLMAILTKQALHLNRTPAERVRMAETGSLTGNAFGAFAVRLGDYF
jgi:hypothetical protein